MASILRTDVLSQFQCLGERCEDTCCQGWSMQLDAQTRELYQKEKPQLLDAVEAAQESPWIMRKAPSGFCVKFDGGLCGIHKEHGERFLGDACFFYPRATRSLGGRPVMTATLSCPEIARLALFSDNPAALAPAEAERLPNTLKDYLPAGLSADDALAVHQAFLRAAADASGSAEKNFLRIASASRSLERIDVAQWKVMAEFYLSHADARIPAAEADVNDPFNLLHALCGLTAASRKPPSPRLRQTASEMELALGAKLGWENVQIATHEDSLSRSLHLKELWQNGADMLYTPILRRWLQMQMSLSLHPFSGLGQTLSQRVTLVGLRLAIIKLALCSRHSIDGVEVSHENVIRIVQSLSRLMDHLGDPEFSLKICAETGWTSEARMHGLLQ